MNEGSKLKVHVEFGEMKANFEGDADEVFKALSRFLVQVYPNLEIVQRLVYAPDLIKISENLVGLIELTSEGPILASLSSLSAKEMICLALLGAYVGHKLGKLSKDGLSSDELARITSKAKKTIMNELPKLVNSGCAERKSEGEYLITTFGIKQTEEIIQDYKTKTEIKSKP